MSGKGTVGVAGERRRRALRWPAGGSGSGYGLTMVYLTLPELTSVTKSGPRLWRPRMSAAVAEMPPLFSLPVDDDLRMHQWT